MRKITLLLTLAMLLIFTSPVLAGIVTTGDVIAVSPPLSVDSEASASNDRIIVFPERANVTLASPTAGLPAGTVVNSYLLHFDPIENPNPAVRRYGTATFDEPILAIIDVTADLTNTDGALGSPTTTYPLPTKPWARGLEVNCPSPPAGTAYDCAYYSGNTITVDLGATSGIDQVRVLTAEITTISAQIDIKPGSDPNSVNLNGNGVIPIAILGSGSFDVNFIDTSTLSFEGLDVRVKGNNAPQCSVKNVNGDAFDDLVCQFVDDGSLTIGSGTAKVTGKLNGTPFEGSDSINIVP